MKTMENKPKTLLLIIVIYMSSIGLIATDIYLPVLPEITTYFNVSGNILQISISVYLYGLAISQLIYGPLSDKYGRKPVVFFGISIFTISSFIIIFAPNITVLLIARFMQAVGACSGITIGRVIIGEVYSKKETGRIFATIFPFIGLSPAIAPVIGGFINTYMGWRTIFGFLGIIGVILLMLVKFKLPETKNTAIKIYINPKAMLKTYIQLLTHRLFLGYALCPCFAYIVNFAYLSEAPFIFHKYHLSAQTIGFLFITNSISYVIGNFISRLLITKFNLSRILLWGYICFISGGIVMVLLNFNINPDKIIFNLLTPCALLTFSMGFLLPLGSAGVIITFPQIAGYASGLLGFLQLVSAGLSSAFIGKISCDNPFYLSLYIISFTTLGLASYLLLVVLIKASSKNN